jgi:hypothetical protein
VRWEVSRLSSEGDVEIDSFVSPYREPTKSLFSRLLGKMNASQKKYFSISLVERYNQYQMAIVGEEASGFPALGAFEAMACGCLVLVSKEYYKGLGFSEDAFLIHHGIDEILEKIQWVKSNQDKAYIIAMRGNQQVIEKLSQENVGNFLSKAIEQIEKHCLQGAA